MKKLPNACPKPKPAPPKKRQFSSIVDKRSHAERLDALARSRSLRRTPPQKKKRTAKEDHRIYGPQEFRDFLHAHACLGCGYKGDAIEQAHIHTGGKGRKDGYQKTAPLCGSRSRWERGRWIITIGCHKSYDAAKQSWPARMGIDIDVEQDRFWSEWEDHAETLGMEP